MRFLTRFITINPLGWLVIGGLAAILVLTLGCNLVPRDAHPERTPSPLVSCATHGDGFPVKVCMEVEE